MKDKEELPDKSGFTTPEGYFEQLEDRLMEHGSAELPPNNGFAVPEGYFEQLEDRVMEKVQPETPVISLQKRSTSLRWAFAAAAACLLLVLLWNPGPVTDVALPDSGEMMVYLEEEALDLSTDELIAYMDESQLEDLLEEPLAGEDELENYLIEYIDDTELLIELQQ